MDMDWSDLPTPLHLSSKKGSCDFVKLLLDSGATIDAVDHHGPKARQVFSFSQGKPRYLKMKENNENDLRNQIALLEEDLEREKIV